MPQVPRVSGPSVAEQSLQGGMIRATVDPVADRQGGALAQVMFEAGTAMQERQDADQLMRAETEIKTRYLEWESEAKQRRGQQAWGVAKEAAGWWDDSVSKVAQGLDNPLQQRLFAKTANQLRMQSVGAFSAHEAAQRRQSLDDSAQASIVGSINLAAANPQNLELLNSTKADIVKRNQLRAKVNGWDEAITTAKESEYLTNFHKQVMQTLVDRDPAAAEAYFAANQGEIAGSEREAVGKVIKLGVGLRKVQSFADEVVAGGMDEAAALSEARKRFEGDEEKNVVAELKVRFAERTAARERMQRDAADEAYGIYARAGRVSAIPPSVLSKLDGRTLLALRQTAQNDAEGKAVKTDMTAYYALSRLADSDPDAFIKRDLRLDFPALSRADQKHFIDLQAKVKNPEEQIKESTFNRQLTVTFRTLGWGDNQGDLVKKGAFEKAVRDAVRAEESSQKRPLKEAERQSIMDRLLIEGDTNGWLPGGKRRLFEVAGTPDAAKFAAQVPDADRAKIEAALKRAGQKVTDEAVRALYLQKNGLQ